MSPLRARVEKGRLVLNEPTTLPDGMVIDLVADDEGDTLTDEDRRTLHEALAEVLEIGGSRSCPSQFGPRR